MAIKVNIFFFIKLSLLKCHVTVQNGRRNKEIFYKQRNVMVIYATLEGTYYS